jgi:hypothetical protein
MMSLFAPTGMACICATDFLSAILKSFLMRRHSRIFGRARKVVSAAAAAAAAAAATGSGRTAGCWIRKEK